MADLEAIDPKRTALMVLDMHRDVVADDGASKDSGAPEHAAKQNVGNRVPRLSTRKPRDEHGVGPFHEPRNDQRPAAEQHDDDRRSGRTCAVEHGFGERALLARQLRKRA